MHRLLRATEHVYGYLWQKNEVILLSSFRDYWCTKLKNFGKSVPKKSIDRRSVGKSPKNRSGGQGIDFYHANHFSNLFRIWWRKFLAKQILKKSFFKVIPNSFFLIFLSPKRSKKSGKLGWEGHSKMIFSKICFARKLSHQILNKFEKWFAW